MKHDGCTVQDSVPPPAVAHDDDAESAYIRITTSGHYGGTGTIRICGRPACAGISICGVLDFRYSLAHSSFTRPAIG
jgi:hypothetical protein